MSKAVYLRAEVVQADGSELTDEQTDILWDKIEGDGTLVFLPVEDITPRVKSDLDRWNEILGRIVKFPHKVQISLKEVDVPD